MLLTLACIALRRPASAPVAALFLIVVFGLACVPWNPGDGASMVSHAGFYNRWGWAALAVLMQLGCFGQGRAGPRWLADAVIVAFVLPLLFFLKIAYFLVVFAFVVRFGLLQQRFLKAAVAGLATFLGVVFSVQAMAGYILPHLQQGGAAGCGHATFRLGGLCAAGDSECSIGLRLYAGTRVCSGIRLGLERQSALVRPFAAGHVGRGVGLNVRLLAAAVRCPSSHRGLPCEHSTLQRQWIQRCMTFSLGIDDGEIRKGAEKLSRSAAI